MYIDGFYRDTLDPPFAYPAFEHWIGLYDEGTMYPVFN